MALLAQALHPVSCSVPYLNRGHLGTGPYAHPCEDGGGPKPAQTVLLTSGGAAKGPRLPPSPSQQELIPLIRSNGL